MGRSPCCENVGLKRRTWTPEEDQKLLAYIEENGHGSWPALPAKAGLQRCGKSCRLRWTNYLRPDIKRGKFSLQEEQSIIQLHALLGNRWSAIATHLPKRTDNDIKNYWNSHLKKRLTKMGIDPVTHKPKSDSLNPGQVKVAATLSHIAQWESTRLEAEARESTLLRSFSSSSAQLVLNKANALPPLQPPPLPLQPLCLDVLTACKGAWLTTLLKENGSTITGTLEAPTSTLNFSDKQLLIRNLGKSNNNNGEVKESMDNTVLVSNFMEGLTDLFIENSHDHLEHDLNDFEENNNYWNNILNLVNSTSPSIDSPVF